MNPSISEKWVPQSLAQLLPDLTNVGPTGMPIWGKWANNYNYRSSQVHETLNGVNPSSGLKDMCSAMYEPNLWPIWQVFGPWVSPHGTNGQMTITVHNYGPGHFHRIWNEENWSVKRLQRYGFDKSGSRPPGSPEPDDNTPPSLGATNAILG